MQLSLSGHHVEVTPSMRAYVERKLERISRHFDHVFDVHFVLTVEKLRQKAAATLHVRGNAIHADAIEEDMYAAIHNAKGVCSRQQGERVTAGKGDRAEVVENGVAVGVSRPHFKAAGNAALDRAGKTMHLQTADRCVGHNDAGLTAVMRWVADLGNAD